MRLSSVRLSLAALLVSLVVPGCYARRSSIPQLHSSAAQVVRTYIAAYNRHDVPAIVAMLDSSFTWFSVEGDSIRVETRGVTALERSLREYLARLPSARSEIDGLTVLGPWVTVNERATRQGANGARRQSSTSVYEVANGKIRRVWYYPVVMP